METRPSIYKKQDKSLIIRQIVALVLRLILRAVLGNGRRRFRLARWHFMTWSAAYESEMFLLGARQ